jgi:hypothetical protein
MARSKATETEQNRRKNPRWPPFRRQPMDRLLVLLDAVQDRGDPLPDDPWGQVSLDWRATKEQLSVLADRLPNRLAVRRIDFIPNQLSYLNDVRFFPQAAVHALLIMMGYPKPEAIYVPRPALNVIDLPYAPGVLGRIGRHPAPRAGTPQRRHYVLFDRRDDPVAAISASGIIPDRRPCRWDVLVTAGREHLRSPLLREDPGKDTESWLPQTVAGIALEGFYHRLGLCRAAYDTHGDLVISWDLFEFHLGSYYQCEVKTL